jgi:hypothetical protein
MSSWTCPHDIDGVCQRVAGAQCSPGMRGCTLHGRFRFAQDEIAGGERKPVKAAPTPSAPVKRPRSL